MRLNLVETRPDRRDDFIRRIEWLSGPARGEQERQDEGCETNWGHHPFAYSAASRRSAPPRSTLTRRLTPFSTIVTPNRRCIRLIVTALWVTIR